jgi:cyclomaltodextrinase / maltogenic alpha-amylase / neopullulanase
MIPSGRVLYHMHALGAAGVPAVNPDSGASRPCGHGLRALEGWLDHIGALGCGGVMLSPVFASSTHGYDTVDPFRIDQRLGDDDDFDRFVGACHRLDLELVLDGVFNHVGRAFPRFADVLHQRGRGPSAEWFRLHPSQDEGDGFSYDCFEGHRDLVTLNHESPAVLEWAVAVSRHWLDRGVDGWRLDAAYAIPHPFLAALVGAIRSRHPAAFLFGEVIHGNYSEFVGDTGLDSVTQYELYKAIWSSLHDANFFELAWALERHGQHTTRFAPVTFVGNHDVTRLASHLPDPDHRAAAFAVLFTVPGLPCLYYGDEFAWQGIKEQRLGGDDAIRPPVPTTAEPVDVSFEPALIALRRARPWLTTAKLEVVDLANRHVTYTVRDDDQALIVLIDLDETHVAAPTGWQPVVLGPRFAVGEPT